MFEPITNLLDHFDKGIIESAIGLAVEIARDGREGRRIGTIFIIGDEQRVLEHSRPLILDPLAGHPDEVKHINDANLRGTIKELAQLDGAFVFSAGGIALSACRYIDTDISRIELPLGLGSRHLAAASITNVTRALGIVVSESAMVRVFFNGGMVAEIIPELWMISRRCVHLTGHYIEHDIKDLAIFTYPQSLKTKQ
ncbi:MAG: diadenylate cyclase [Acidobacteriota bacterium]